MPFQRFTLPVGTNIMHCVICTLPCFLSSELLQPWLRSRKENDGAYEKIMIISEIEDLINGNYNLTQTKTKTFIMTEK